MKEKQTDQIEKHLHTYGSITPIVALNAYGCMRLASRIFDLRSQGMKIVTNRMPVMDRDEDISYIAQYVLVKNGSED
ncbi:MAG: helix-turn-helix domain-containing protein [Lachnospiraceae bacterium]|jgi:hypothetical protein|nr:helix-turn-helix domain-containing protein [Lachnospiraceae bacterium]